MRTLLIGTMLALTTIPAIARDQIRIVGSSTVYPFTTTVAEQFHRAGNKAPIVESTGTGGGFKLFCDGVGTLTPDVTNASRRIKGSELDLCEKNGVTEIIEIKIGYDGLVLVQSKKGKIKNLTTEQIFLALAELIPVNGKLVQNPYNTWFDIDPVLPKYKIEVLGPPPTSGTRDSFHELIMMDGAKKVLKNLNLDAKAIETASKALRKDGSYVEAGENDNVIVQKLQANPQAVGIFGYSFLDENTATLTGVHINGTEPNYQSINAGKYIGAREMFIYVKNQHIGVIKNLDKFMAEYVSERAVGNNGYLSRKGLVTLPKDEVAKVRENVSNRKTLSKSDLK